MKISRLIIFILLIAFTSNVVSQTVYTTKTGEKYHKSSCRYLKHSKKEIKIEEAKGLGYIACKVCKPSKSKTIPKASNITSQNKTSIKKTTASQCTGKTKAGKRCKRKTKNASGRCYQH